MTPRAWWLVLAVALVVAAGAEAAYVFWWPTRSADHARYEVFADGMVGVFVAALVAGAAGSLVVGPYRGRVALLSLLATTLLISGVLAIFSIGVLLLAVALPVWVVLGRAMRNDARDLPRMAAGAALAIGLLVLALAFTRPPTVECLLSGGVRGSLTHWWGGGPSSSSGEGTGSVDGRVASGTVQADGATVHYTCRDGHLVEFRRDIGG